MTELNNPAARLNRWLQDTCQRTESTPNMDALTAWCETWGLDRKEPTDQVECIRRGLALIETGGEARRRTEDLVARVPYVGVMLEHFDQVERALSHFVGLSRCNIQEFFGSIKDTGWHSLEQLDALLSHESPEAFLRDEDEQSLIDQTNDLINAVLNDTSLSEADKTLLVDKLRDVLAALHRVRITGAADVQKAADSLTGALIRVYVRSSEFAGSTSGKLLFALIGSIAAALGHHEVATAIGGSLFGQALGLPAGSDRPAGP